jgi:hypothetical protein
MGICHSYTLDGRCASLHEILLANASTASTVFGDSSHGGTITFQDIGAPGSTPAGVSLHPASAPRQRDACCMARHEVASDTLTPWNEALIMTLRGPLLAQQVASISRPCWRGNGTAWRGGTCERRAMRAVSRSSATNAWSRS